MSATADTRITVQTPTGAYTHGAFTGGTWTHCGKRVSAKATRVRNTPRPTCEKCAAEHDRNA